jgi:hypothetical protein
VKRRGYDIDAYAKLWRHVPDREWQARMYWSRVLPPGQLVMKGSGPRLRLWFEQPVMARMSPVGHCTVHSAPGALWRHDPTRNRSSQRMI